MGTLTISMAMFNSYLNVYQRVNHGNPSFSYGFPMVLTRVTLFVYHRVTAPIIPGFSGTGRSKEMPGSETLRRHGTVVLPGGGSMISTYMCSMICIPYIVFNDISG